MSVILGLRKELAKLAPLEGTYRSLLRTSSLTCSLVTEDWLTKHCRPEDYAEHLRYLEEFAQEAILADRPSEILSDLNFPLQSTWLRKKREVETSQCEIAQNPDFLELSPCLKELHRAKKSVADADSEKIAELYSMFLQRRDHELKIHRESIDSVLNFLPAVITEAALQAAFAGRLANAIPNELGGAIRYFAVRNQSTRQDEMTRAIFFAGPKNLSFAIIPVVSASGADLRSVAGSVGIGFRLMSKEAIESEKFAFDRDVILPFDFLLPNRFVEYGHFSSGLQFGLNVFAWCVAASAIVPDVLALLRNPSI